MLYTDKSKKYLIDDIDEILHFFSDDRAQSTFRKTQQGRLLSVCSFQLCTYDIENHENKNNFNHLNNLNNLNNDLDCCNMSKIFIYATEKIIITYETKMYPSTYNDNHSKYGENPFVSQDADLGSDSYPEKRYNKTEKKIEDSVIITTENELIKYRTYGVSYLISNLITNS